MDYLQAGEMKSRTPQAEGPREKKADGEGGTSLVVKQEGNSEVSPQEENQGTGVQSSDREAAQAKRRS